MNRPFLFLLSPSLLTSCKFSGLYSLSANRHVSGDFAGVWKWRRAGGEVWLMTSFSLFMAPFSARLRRDFLAWSGELVTQMLWCEGLRRRSVTRCVGLMQKQVKHWLDGYFEGCQKALILREVECGCDRGIWEEGRREKKKGKQPLQTHKHTRPCHTPALHTRTHTSAPSNNPLILFIISQLFLVRAIHERNHTHKHTPMCRAEIQYKYTHLYFLISSSIFTPCFFFFAVFPLRSVMHQLRGYTSQSHINAPASQK